MRFKSLLIAVSLIASITGLAESKSLGKGTSGKATHSIDEILKASKSFENKTVEVEGEITDVCPMKGCWVDLKSESGQKIHVKVKDDVIVFPKTSKGKKVMVKGKVVSKKLTKAQAVKYYKHRADELGQKFDPKSVTGPVTIFQIEGTGATLHQ